LQKPRPAPQPQSFRRRSQRALPACIAAFAVADAVVGVRYLLPSLAQRSSANSRVLHAAAALCAALVLAHLATLRLVHARFRHPATPPGWSRGLQSRGLRFCDTCRVVQVASSHHCSRCRRCVAERSHHCPYLGVCVGMHTLRPFTLFLACAAAGSAFALLVCAAVFHSRRGEVLEAGWRYSRENPLPSELAQAPRGVLLARSLRHLAAGARHALLSSAAPRWVLPLALLLPLNATAFGFSSALLARSVRTAGLDAAAAARQAGRPGGEEAGGEGAWAAVSRHLFGAAGAGAAGWALLRPRVEPPPGSHAHAVLKGHQHLA